MSTPKSRSQRAARFALRLDRHTHNHQITSYRENTAPSSSPTSETELSWEDFADDRWPSDAWVVGADIDPALWPELWTFLLSTGGAR
jgi:hypothetical protein